ncbi:hypothetical protein CAOG_06601 [Capsaspora owczarzaki ATCC 30864]|uniref:Huntingtin interacting protein 1 n=1 Tax=Capsaspora owczarzaki (strain ATCC 30864) TaxID=595528 RepID=A0A0D2VX96_CAPO3|nr:hypothetical protein CAOG_06601 [Capsaspora owczarzaki ATCC 30864]KJE96247.1 hypothetical protein CAOG_006601 [Capsaspora owczarzaki ATCC 30864]|eukprot:XP_004344222.1 hypothetical protein CAOG_06601 [Capsaspora owczarzaki ATCC 30864]
MSAERDKVIKESEEHLTKACSPSETAPKVKHIRTAIISTWNQNGSDVFWAALRKLPLGTQPIMCWKALITLHKILQDGHPNVLRELVRNQGVLASLGQMWESKGHIFSPLIAGYLRFLISKLDFHDQHTDIPGNLDFDAFKKSSAMSDLGSATRLVMACFILQDKILATVGLVLNSLSGDRASEKNECREAAFLPLIPESVSLYNIVVDILTTLHRSTPEDELIAHRERFMEQFPRIKKFYFEARNLRFLTNLVQIPLLDSPPDFITKYANAPTPPPAKVAAPAPVNKFEDFDAMPNQFEFVDERDKIIEALRARIAELEAQVQSLIARSQQDQMLISSLQQRLNDLQELLQTAQTSGANELKEKVEAAESKYNKVFQMYSKLRQEHLEALKKVGQVSEFEAFANRAKEEKENADRAHAQELSSLRSANARLESLMHDLQTKTQESEAAQQRVAQERRRILAHAVADSKRIIRQALAELENPQNPGSSSSTAQSVDENIHNTLGVNQRLSEALAAFAPVASAGTNEVPFDVLGNASVFANMLAELLNNSKGTTRLAADQTVADGIIAHCRSTGQAALAYFDTLHCNNENDSMKFTAEQVGAGAAKFREAADSLAKITEGLIPREIKDSDSLGDAVEKQMSEAAMAINDAARRIQEMLEKSKKTQSGIQLDVNESILASAQQLMDLIRILIQKSTVVQQEVVAASRGSASATEFYKKNHRWTEGLISAAKAVGWGATLLVDNADKVVNNMGKFEELMVAAGEVAASTAQLVASSRVKSAANSKSQEELMGASRDVTGATRNLVSAAKNASQLMADQASNKQVQDLSKLTLTQAKRQEMNQQVKVLELEQQLSQERTRLLELRKVHYHLAGDVGNE